MDSSRWEGSRQFSLEPSFLGHSSFASHKLQCWHAPNHGSSRKSSFAGGTLIGFCIGSLITQYPRAIIGYSFHIAFDQIGFCSIFLLIAKQSLSAFATVYTDCLIGIDDMASLRFGMQLTYWMPILLTNCTVARKDESSAASYGGSDRSGQGSTMKRHCNVIKNRKSNHRRRSSYGQHKQLLHVSRFVTIFSWTKKQESFCFLIATFQLALWTVGIEHRGRFEVVVLGARAAWCVLL